MIELIVIISVLIISIVIISFFFTRGAEKEVATTVFVSSVKSEEIKNLEREIDNFFSYMKRLESEYIPHSYLLPIRLGYESLFKKLKRISISRTLDSEYRKKALEFLNAYNNLEEYVESKNKLFVEKEKNICTQMFSLDGKRLDAQQQTAVVTDEDYNLVLAGAGSGKTLTITGKVKYLCERKGVKPDQILLIAFAKKAAEEMTERISKQGYSVEAKTFHKLGLEIISKSKGFRPDVLEEGELQRFLEDYFRERIMDKPLIIEALIQYLALYLQVPGDIKKFDNLGSLYEHERNADFETLKSKFANEKRTLQGEFVKSLQEVQIANFLFLNGVEYEYEKKYPFPSDDPYRKMYTPDFYLTDYDIYLEHFGINEKGKAPWLSQVEAQKYTEGMEWKRAFHKRNGTKLIETYSWYFSEGKFEQKLKALLFENGVELKEVDYKEIYSKTYKDISDKNFREFMQLCKTFITLFKANGYKPKDIDSLKYKTNEYNNPYYKERTRLFKKILKPILIDYNKMLEKSGKVDFSDMILDATDVVKSGFKIPRYKYVIIDEFQDISISRYKLVKSILDASGAHLLCVGDDWQSIYRFSGSDLGVFTDFEKYFGFSKIMRIEKTYRNSQQLIDSASDFIMKNPLQMRKALYSDKETFKPLNFYVYQDRVDSAIAVAIDEIIKKYGEEKNILLLGRTKFDKDALLQSKLFSARKSNGRDVIVYKKNTKVDIEFMTVHKSKGLEADNVIILNFNNTLLGFPNKIADDPILELTLSSSDTFLYGEERRLLYVAMTRTKNEVAFIMENLYPSEFLHDFEDDQNVVIKNIDCDGSIVPVNCPRCITGRLVVRKNENKKEFLGCSNYPHCQYTVNDTSVLSSPQKCSCGGFLILRKGRYGNFYGCSNYPYCKETVEVGEGDRAKILQETYHLGEEMERTRRKTSSNGALCICGGRMVLRNGKYGPFYGCSNYPRCHRTKEIYEIEK